MNNINIKLHKYQKDILSKLVNAQSLRSNKLLIPGLASEHMNYHLKQLIDLNLVEKLSSSYTLTNEGKDYTSLMDDNVEFIEKQPKTSILLRVARKNDKGEVEHLLTKRLRQPYLGKVGHITGKVKFGETIIEAAQRELYEETGLEAKSIILEQIYHKLRNTKDGKFLQDIIFYRFFITELTGEFITMTQHQENMWLTTKEATNGKYDLFDDLNLTDRFEPEPLSFVESISGAIDY